MDEELERFKTRINLSEYAAAQGYELDKRESWPGGAVMRHGNGDKIIIARLSRNNHWVYWSCRDDRDNGSVIDFLQNRKGGSLGQIRQSLREWCGSSSVSSARPSPDRFAREVIGTEKNRGRVMVAFAGMKIAGAHPYLVHERKIPAAVLTSKRFAGQVRIDGYGNAVFPHIDDKGLCGYELRNSAFQGFSKHGEKALWFSRTFTGDKRLVVCEAAIDALSYHALKPQAHTRYVSIGGQVNPRQPALLSAAVAKMPEGSEIVAAMDNDGAGRKLAALVEDAMKGSGRDDLVFRLDLPETEGMDWNDVLRTAVSPETAASHSFPVADLKLE